MFDKIISRSKGLEKALDAAWIRNEAITQNIANIDTPGYKRKTVSFEQYLGDAENNLKGFRSDERHIPIGAQGLKDLDIRVTEDNRNLNMRLDGNNVDIDSEMALMAKNSIKYNVLIDKINGGFKKLKSVIRDGR